MYCVKCGVKLDDSLERCPLCGTPVWRPEEAVDPTRSFSGIYPQKQRNERLAVVSFLTALSLLASFILLRICLRLYGSVGWAGYATLAIALGYVLFLLPLWFRSPNPIIFLPIDHAAVGGYLLYVCLKTGGHWFLSFAFPVVCMSCLLLTTLVVLLKYVQGGRLFIIGGWIIAAGGLSILVEFFQHITFGSRMFTWSLYVVSPCAALGIFLLLAGMIRPLREYLERRFFL